VREREREIHTEDSRDRRGREKGRKKGGAQSLPFIEGGRTERGGGGDTRRVV